MRSPLRRRLFATLLLTPATTTPAFAAGLVVLSPQTWDRYGGDTLGDLPVKAD